MQEFFNLFVNIDPVGVVLTIFAGLVWGFLFRSFELDNKTTLILLAFYAPLLVSRLLYAISFGVTGAGFIGFFFLFVYALSAVISRKFFRKDEERRDKIVSDLLKKVDRRNIE